MRQNLIKGNATTGKTHMPEVICTTVYQFPELSDAAKDKARSWYRELGPHDD